MLSALKKSLVVALAVTAPVQATFVVQCLSRLLDQRSDPIVQPGRVSPHVHVIAGGNGFNVSSMTYDDARNSECSSCNIKEDLSAYWTPKLYYRAQNGSFISVPIEGDDAQGNYGGMAIYYLHRPGPDNDEIVPFPPGFRMVAGNPFKRTPGIDFASLAVSHRCIGTDLETGSFPNVTCPGGIRTQVVFPGCWNGELDAPDHESHVSYPIDGNYDGGRCPSSHPKHIMTLFYEVTYRTDQFADMWWDDGTQPFVLATGDPTGYGFHGDFFSGWDPATLQTAITDCTDGKLSCPDQTFTYFTDSEMQQCKLPSRIDEQTNGVLGKLPGCNPVSFDSATALDNNKNCAENTTFEQAAPPITAAGGWSYLGCGTDDIMNGRTLTGDSFTDDAMTPKRCAAFCSDKGHKYAGLEWSSECYCGNTLPADRAPKTGVYGNCQMACSGDSTQYCGGNGALSIYQAPSEHK